MSAASSAINLPRLSRPAPDNTAASDPNTKDDSLFWDQYIKEADMYDKELVKSLGGDLDTLLIFAGLFSAVNTAFIIESYQDLKPDPAESGGTNELLRTLIQATNNSTATAATDFTPAPSLLPSTPSSSPWLNEYERTGESRASHARARQRHAKYLSMQHYRSEVVMQSLGTILQASLFLFFVALASWLWGINHAIAAVVIVGFAITFTFYISTTIISIYDATSPFSTRFSAILRSLYHASEPNDTSTAVRADRVANRIVGISGMDQAGRMRRMDVQLEVARMDGKCIAWVRDNATMFESVAGMARAAVHLPEVVRNELALGHTHVGPVLLRSVISSNAIPLGITNGTLFSTVNTLRDAMTSWKGVPISLACDVVAQLHQTLRLTVFDDPAVSESIALILERFASIFLKTLSFVPDVR